MEYNFNMYKITNLIKTHINIEDFNSTQMGNFDLFVKRSSNFFDGNYAMDSEFPRTLVEFLIKHMAFVVAKKKYENYEEIFNYEQQLIYAENSNKNGPKKSVNFHLLIAKRLAPDVDYNLYKELNSVYRDFSKHKHSFVEISEQQFEIVKSVVEKYFTTIFDLDEEKYEDAVIIHDIPKVEEISSTDDFAEKFMDGWIRSIKKSFNPFTGQNEKYISFISMQRGYSASNRESIEILDETGRSDFQEGLTYQVKVKIVNGKYFLISKKKMDKPAETKLFFKIIEPLFKKVWTKLDFKISDYILKSPEIEKNKDGFKTWRFTKQRDVPDKDVAKYLRSFETKLSNIDRHWADAFSNFKLLTLDDKESTTQIELDLFEDEESVKTSADLMKVILKNITLLKEVFILRNFFDENKFKEMVASWNSNYQNTDAKNAWESFSNYASLKNPKKSRADYRMVIQSRISNEGFLGLKTGEKIAYLVMRMIEIENDDSNSSIMPISRIKNIFSKMNKVFTEMQFFGEVVRIAAKKTESKKFIDLTNLADEIRKKAAFDLDSTYESLWKELNNSIGFEMFKIINKNKRNGSNHMFVTIHKNDGTMHKDSSTFTEQKVANMLKRYVEEGKTDFNIEIAKNDFKDYDYEYDEMQYKAIEKFFDSKISFIVGKAGSGKTTTVSLLLKKYAKTFPNKKILVLTPTGTSAYVFRKRLATFGVSMGSNIKISTLHSDVDKTFIPNVVIFEESSMMPVYKLATHLEKNILTGRCERVLFLGDSGQLPSIGLGNVLTEISDSELFSNSKTILETNHRQKGSLIFSLANLIRDITLDSEVDFASELKRFSYSDSTSINLVNISDSTAQQKLIKLLISNSSPSLQRVILTPKNIGVLGTKNINSKIQDNIKHSDKKWITDLETYTLQSRVMWIKNVSLYGAKTNGFKREKMLILPNGTDGEIVDIKENDGKVVGLDIVFQTNFSSSDREQIEKLLEHNNALEYQKNLTIELIYANEKDTFNLLAHFNISEDIGEIPFVLNFATTFHKVQGGQFDVVDIILEPNDDDSQMRLYKEHLYTAITRAVKRVNIWAVGHNAFDVVQGIAMETENRHQLLKEFIDNQ